MDNFTPISSVIGGVLIGLSGVLLWLTHGRIAGISGILGGLMAPGRAWRATFLLGLIAAPLLYASVVTIPARTVTAGPAMLVVAGLLVGVGTALGGGCTSGHGVCGIARLSVRSIVATLLFMGAGGLTVFIARHIVGI